MKFYVLFSKSELHQVLPESATVIAMQQMKEGFADEMVFVDGYVGLVDILIKRPVQVKNVPDVAAPKIEPTDYKNPFKVLEEIDWDKLSSIDWYREQLAIIQKKLDELDRVKKEVVDPLPTVTEWFGQLKTLGAKFIEDVQQAAKKQEKK